MQKNVRSCELQKFENSLKTVKVMTKTKVAPFYLGHGVYLLSLSISIIYLYIFFYILYCLCTYICHGALWQIKITYSPKTEIRDVVETGPPFWNSEKLGKRYTFAVTEIDDIG